MKVATAVAVAASLSLLSGCFGTKQPENVNEEANKTHDEQPAALNRSGLPIVGRPITLTFFTGKMPMNGSSFEETLVWKRYAEMSNVHVRFELVPFENLGGKRSLALASGDYPDAFYSARLSASELMNYGAKGTLVRLNDLIGKYAPNFSKLLDKYPDLRKGLTMPDGGIYSFPSFYDPAMTSMLIGTPLWVKKEWLDKFGMPEPSTTEQLYEYLKAVKERDPNGNGIADEIPYSGEGITQLIDQLKGAWGFGNRGLGHKYVDMSPDKAGELRFFRIDPKFKEVIAYLRRLYAEGLIDKEIFSIKMSALYVKGQKGLLGATINPNPVTQMNQTGYVGLGALQGPYGDKLYTQMKVPLIWLGAFAITDKNKYPEATVRWMDYFFGDEGATFFFMGEKGVTYKETAPGKLEFIDEITHNSYGMTQDEALRKYVTWLGGSYPGYVQPHYFKGSEMLPESLAAGEKAAPYAVKELWYNFNFTEEETDFMSTTGSDIHSYITGMEARFITGLEPMDNWDKYADTVRRMGLEDYMRVYRTAYERYSRSK